MATARRIVVVGGGVSGLAAAHHLMEIAEKHGHPIQVSLREAGTRVGGVISTRRQDGYLLEEGPDSILTEKPWALDLAKRIGVENRVIGTRPEYRRAFVACNGKLQPTPDGFYLLAPTRLLPLATTPIFTWPAKMRMALDLIIPRRRSQADESLARRGGVRSVASVSAVVAG